MFVWLLAISCLLLGTFSSGEELDTFSSEEKLVTFSSGEELDTFSSEEKLGTFSSGEELGTFSSGEEGVQLVKLFCRPIYIFNKRFSPVGSIFPQKPGQQG